MKPVKIYVTDSCPYCVMAGRLLAKKGVDYEEIDLTGNDEARMDLVKRSGGLRTVPQIWIGDHHVGGYDQLSELDRSGELDKLLEALARA